MLMTHHAQFQLVPDECTPVTIVLKDIGFGLVCKSLTNDARHVVRIAHLLWNLTADKRLFYYDSLGKLDELLHDGAGNFLGFAPGPGRTEAEMRGIDECEPA